MPNSLERNGDLVFVGQDPLRAALEGQHQTNGFGVAIQNIGKERRTGGTKEDLVLITPDKVGGYMEDIRVRIEALKGARPINWDTAHEIWAYVHPYAYTSSLKDPHYEAEIFKDNSLTAELGSEDRMFEFYAKHGGLAPHNKPTDMIEYNAPYVDPLKAVKPGSQVHFATVFPMAYAINAAAPTLKANGSKIVEYTHEAVPDNYHRSPFGMEVLRAYSAADIVFVHIDAYRRNLEKSLAAAGLPIPDIRRMDLAIERNGIQAGIDFMTQPNAEQAALNIPGLRADQHDFLRAMYQAKANLPHRFICFDRLDPIKGIHTVLSAFDAYFESLGLPKDELRRQYNVGFISDFLDMVDTDEMNPTAQYRSLARAQLRAMQAKYPGIFEATSNLPRQVLPGIVEGATTITGGAHDGLNFTGQEGPYINYLLKKPATSIVGSRAGFATQTLETGHGHLGHFPEAGNVGDFVAHIKQIVHLQQNDPSSIIARNARLVEEVILPRKDTAFMPQ